MIFGRKAKQAEYIVDVHCHILPGIDDGSRSMEETLKMLRIAADEGITHVIATPHYKLEHNNATPGQVDELIDAVQAEASKNNIPDELFSEAEGLIKLDIAMQLFQSCNITVFTIYNDRILKKIPKRAEWLEKTYLLSIPKNMDLQNVTAAIAKIYWRDRLSVQKSKGNDIYTDNVRRSKLCIDTVLSNILADNATCDDELTAMNYCMLDMIKNL